MNAPRTGTVALVGAGPGAPEMVTQAALDALRRADVVVYDRLAAPELLDVAPARAQRVYVGKAPGRHSLPQSEIIELLIRYAREGKRVVRLKGGDPYIFGRGGEEAAALAEAGVPFCVIPGVTAACAAAAYAGIPLTHRDLSSAVTFVTGRLAADRGEGGDPVAAAARAGGTLVVYMGVGRLEEIVCELRTAGRPDDETAALVMWAGTPRQRTVTAPLSNLPQAAREAGIGPPAVLIVGDVVALRSRLAWFERLPLFGRRVLITRPADRAGSMAYAFRSLGAEAVAVPVIRTEPLPLSEADRAMLASAGREFDVVVFTSAFGVACAFDALYTAGEDARALAGARIAVIGPATAAALARRGITADIMPDEFVAESLVDAVSRAFDAGLTGRRILLARAAAARARPVRMLRELGADVHELALYRTVVCADSAARLAETLEPLPDVITFTSPSCVRAFMELCRRSGVDLGPEQLSSRAAGIGPITSEALAAFGASPAVEARPHTGEALVEAVVRTFGQPGDE